MRRQNHCEYHLRFRVGCHWVSANALGVRV